MCGIAGILTYSPLADLPDRLSKMAQTMYHRGPDDEGIYISPDQRVGLVNRRLAIRDLSPAGHMPMSNQAGNVWITYNGEVYNTSDLKPELEHLGYQFRSTSDTEVILHGYEAWGQGVVSRLEGMFAFAIYDQRETPRIFIARDQMGIKPLYYSVTAEAVVFASELKTLLASGLVSQAISPAGLVGYLLMGSVPNPLTIYEDIRALEPACFINLSLEIERKQCLEPTIYWQLPTDTSPLTAFSQAAEQIEHLLAEAVRIRLVSDVPLGVFLSGGLDSSLVVAMMRQVTTGPIRTCSIAFRENALSEGPLAHAMAEAAGTEHFERVVTPEDVDHEFDHILQAMDQPSVDGVNTYFVSKTAREAGLTVALSGLGGDELFGGYTNTFNDVPQMLTALRRAHSVPGGLWLARQFIQVMCRRPGWDRVLDALDRPPSLASAYLTRRGLFSPSQVQNLVHPDLWEAAQAQFDPVQHVAERANGRSNVLIDPFAWISRAELRTYTHHQLLRDTDVMSMAHSLEVRVPYFDTRLVETVLRLPTSVKVGGGPVPKPLLTHIARQHIPERIWDRQEKKGFVFPFGDWLRGKLKAKSQQVLSHVQQSKLIQEAAVGRVYQQYEAREMHWSRVWALVALEATQQ